MSSTNACWTWSQQPGIRNSGYFSETCPVTLLEFPDHRTAVEGRRRSKNTRVCEQTFKMPTLSECVVDTTLVLGGQTQVSMDFSNQLFKLLIQEIVLGKEGLLFQPRPGHFESWYYLHPARTVLFMYVSRHLFSSSSDGNDGNEKMCRVFTAHPWREMGELRE